MNQQETTIKSDISGYYRCPAVSTVQDATELEWLIDNHPNFRDYKKV